MLILRDAFKIKSKTVKVRTWSSVDWGVPDQSYMCLDLTNKYEWTRKLQWKVWNLNQSEMMFSLFNQLYKPTLHCDIMINHTFYQILGNNVLKFYQTFVESLLVYHKYLLKINKKSNSYKNFPTIFLRKILKLYCYIVTLFN